MVLVLPWFLLEYINQLRVRGLQVVEGAIRKLEDRYGRADGSPPRHMRMLVAMSGSRPSLEGAMCSAQSGRTALCLRWSGSTNTTIPEELTEAELDRWIARFPIEGA